MQGLIEFLELDAPPTSPTRDAHEHVSSPTSRRPSSKSNPVPGGSSNFQPSSGEPSSKLPLPALKKVGNKSRKKTVLVARKVLTPGSRLEKDDIKKKKFSDFNDISDSESDQSQGLPEMKKFKEASVSKNPSVASNSSSDFSDPFSKR